MSASVIVLNGWASKPVFHAFGRYERDDQGWYDVTICGRKAPRYALHLREDHAEKFARPCARCFVVEQAQGETP